jgi:hypothetical protein
MLPGGAKPCNEGSRRTLIEMSVDPRDGVDCNHGSVSCGSGFCRQKEERYCIRELHGGFGFAVVDDLIL